MLRAVTLIALVGCLAAAPAASAKVRCTGDPDAVQRLDITVAGQPA